MEAFSLFIIAQKRLPDFFKYEPETLRESLRITALECEKLLACQTVFHNHLAFTSHNVFEKVCMVFNDEPADFMNTQDFTPAEVTWTLLTMRMLDPVSPFSAQVLSYVAFAFYKDGFISLPKVIQKEKSDQNIKATWFLDNYNKNKELTPEAKKIQQKMVQSVEEYCMDRVNKVVSELSTIWTPEQIKEFTLSLESLKEPTQ